MSYKLGLIISFPFLIFLFLFLADLAMISIEKQQLDALAITVSYRISLEGRLSDGTVSLARESGIRLYQKSEQTPRIGETVVFVLEKDYTPLIIASSTMTLRTTRTSVVGYYKN